MHLRDESQTYVKDDIGNKLEAWMHLRDESQEEEGLRAIVKAAEKRQVRRVQSECTRKGKG